MLTDLQLRNFRCFDALAIQFAPGFNFLVGENGQGKTSILEGACVLLRLQSQRSASLAPLVKIGQPFFRITGRYNEHHLEFTYSPLRRKVEFDRVEQRRTAEFLQVGRVVSFATTDIELLRGGSDFRRRYLDFLGAQIDQRYRPTLRAYERALRSRNALLKSPHPQLKQIEAYDPPLMDNGVELLAMRAALVKRLAPFAAEAHSQISGTGEALAIKFAPGANGDFAEELKQSRERELRLRQTVVGPHRDDLEIFVQEVPAQQFASEGQQRTVALALKISQARLLSEETGAQPLFLIDDIFGELDPGRRNALLTHLPPGGQKLVTATTLHWLEGKPQGPLFHLSDKSVVIKS